MNTQNQSQIHSGPAVLKIGSACILFLAVFLGTGCAKAPYTMTAPESFKQFENTRKFRMITAEGVMLSARHLENYPRASLKFWTDAMGQHMVKQGYSLVSSECFQTDRRLDGCTNKFMLPHGAEDWTLSETIFVVEKWIVVVEAAGEFSRYEAVETELKSAIKTFDPNL